MTDVRGWRRHAATAFIVAWLAIQIVTPLVQKFDLPAFRYRWARFGWGMYSRLVPRYEVRLFRVSSAGQTEAIPAIDRYVRGYRSPEAMTMLAVYASEDEVYDRFSRLVSYVAREERDGSTYVASIRWIDNPPAGVPTVVEFRAASSR